MAPTGFLSFFSSSGCFLVPLFLLSSYDTMTEGDMMLMMDDDGMACSCSFLFVTHVMV